MGAKNYFDAAFPAPWQILGVPLKPFSLGHYLKLRQFDSPFVSDETKPAEVGDLLLGILVCSMASHPDPSQDEFYQWWNEPAQFSLWAWMFNKKPMTPAEHQIVGWGRKIKTFDASEKIKLFAEYIKAHSEAPGYWVLEEPKSRSGAHWVHGTIAGLCSQCGYSQLEAYNVPLSKALQDFLKACEDTGAIRLMTEDELKITEAANGA